MQKNINIESKLNRFEDEIKKLVRRIDDQGRILDSLESDRLIFEDILGRLTAVEERLRIRGHHDIEANKDIKAEINEVKAVVAETIEGSISKNKVVQNKKRSWLSKLFGGGENKK